MRHIKKIKYIIIVMKPSIDLDSRGISEMKRNHHRSYGRSRTRHPSHSNESRRINTVQVMRGQLFVDNIIYMCTNANIVKNIQFDLHPLWFFQITGCIISDNRTPSLLDNSCSTSRSH